MTLWQGRFGDEMAEVVSEFTVSIGFDWELAAEDLDGSRAHVRGLGRSGILSHQEVEVLLAALDRVGEEVAEGRFVFAPADEDVHTAIERRVTELAGDVGAKLHTGRSRNDQVATDLRLWSRRRLSAVARDVVSLQEVLLGRATDVGDAYLPGYTHLQRAQPVLLAHHLLAHAWALARDVDRLIVTVERMDVSPLGAGALAGSSLPLDPDFVAEALGFHARFENSLDAVSDRDFVAEALFDIALLGVHLSRMGEEVVLWSTEEFGFCTLADAYATGSSMLPQKKNPDVAELARGKAGRLIGHLTGLLVTLKGLPALLQPRPPRGQGAAHRLGPAGEGRASGTGRAVRDDRVPPRPDAGGRRRIAGRCGRPRRVPGRTGGAVPQGALAGGEPRARLAGAPRAAR